MEMSFGIALNRVQGPCLIVLLRLSFLATVNVVSMRKDAAAPAIEDLLSMQDSLDVLSLG